MSKHTPGPWEVVEKYHSVRAVGRDHSVEVGPEWRENMRLMAAAPDLLAAAEYMLDYVTLGPSEHTLKSRDHAATKLRTAIARARGED